MARLIKPVSVQPSSRRETSEENARGAWAIMPQTRLSRQIAQQRGFYPVFEPQCPSHRPEEASTELRAARRDLFCTQRVKSALPFRQQLSRENGKWWIQPVSEQRFMLVPESQASSKVRHIKAPNMRKSLPRKPNTSSKLLRYEPNFKAVWPKQSPTIDFKKVSGRVDKDPGPPLIYHINYGAVSPHSQSAHLSDRASRPEESSLPAHMVKVNSRVALGVVQHRSLLMNGFPFSCEAR